MSNPLPSELREKLLKLLDDFYQTRHGAHISGDQQDWTWIDADTVQDIMQLFDKEYQRRSELEILMARLDQIERDFLTYNIELDNDESELLAVRNICKSEYEHNLKQLSKGDNNARSK